MRMLLTPALTPVLLAGALALPLLAALGRPSSAAPAAPPPGATSGAGVAFPFPVKETTLDNGLRVSSSASTRPGIIAYYTVVRTGSRNEVEKGLSGFAHFFEHMMFRGTEKYPQEKYNDVLKALGADSNAFTTDDWTCYHMTVPARRWRRSSRSRPTGSAT